LWIEYGFTMIRRKQPHQVNLSGTSHWSVFGSFAAPNPSGILLKTGGTLAAQNSVGFGTGSGAALISIGQGYPGNYMVTMIINSTNTLTQSPGVVLLAGCTGLALGSTPTAPDVNAVDYSPGSGTCLGSCVNFWISIPTTGAQWSYNSTGVATTTGTWGIDMWITQLSPTVLTVNRPLALKSVSDELHDLRREFAEFQKYQRSLARGLVLEQMELEEASDEEQKRDDVSLMSPVKVISNANSKRASFFR